MNRYQILIEYVGTNYNGWQVQRKGKTIQGRIQNTISKIFKDIFSITFAGNIGESQNLQHNLGDNLSFSYQPLDLLYN